MIWGIILFLVVWTITSCGYVLYHLGNKYRKVPRWLVPIEMVFCIPAYFVAMILGYVGGARRR